MIKFLKSNKFILLILFSICIFFIINPEICSSSCLNAVSVWGLKVFPILFPFFIITRLIINLIDFKPNFMDKFFNKAFHAPLGSFIVFLLSVLCGYPMGAKLVSNLYENKNITHAQAYKMLSFCSISGPMFIIGTVGVGIFDSFNAGIIIFVSNVIACIINGFIYRKKKDKTESRLDYYSSKSYNSLSSVVYDSLISILMVGAYIILSFILIDVIKELRLLTLLSNTICYIANCGKYSNVVESFLVGLLEITRGVIELNVACYSIKLKTILASTIISFGGVSILLQSMGFLSGTNIKCRHVLIQKITQSLICFFITIFICLIFI